MSADMADDLRNQVVVGAAGLHDMLAGLVVHLPTVPSPAAYRDGRGLVRLTVAGGQLLGLAADKDAKVLVATRTGLLPAACDETGQMLDGDGWVDVWVSRVALAPLIEMLARTRGEVSVCTARSLGQVLLVVEEQVLAMPWRLVVHGNGEPSDCARVDVAARLLEAAMGPVVRTVSLVMDRAQVNRVGVIAERVGESLTGVVCPGGMLWGRSREQSHVDGEQCWSEGSSYLALTQVATEAGEVVQRHAYVGAFSAALAQALLEPRDAGPGEPDELEIQEREDFALAASEYMVHCRLPVLLGGYDGYLPAESSPEESKGREVA